MKRFLVLFVMIGLFLVPDIFAGEVTMARRTIGLDDYIKSFSDNRPAGTPNGARIATSYFRVVEREVQTQFCQLDGNLSAIDTAMEWALASYYSPAVVQIRPAEAKVILPTDNPRQSGLILGANAYRDLMELRFLDPSNTRAIGQYEGAIKFIQDNNGVTRAEIIQHYNNGIRDLITEIVDEEFNTISFRIDRHNAVLTRNPQTGEYILNYGGVNTNNEIRTVKGNSPEALSSAMRNGENKNDFTAADYNTVRAQAALIPAVVYAEWKNRGVAGSVDALALITETLTNFYLNPNDNTYLAAYGIRLRYRALLDTALTGRTGDAFAEIALASYNRLVRALNPELLNKFENERRYYTRDAASIPNDRRYDIFSTRYSDR